MAIVTSVTQTRAYETYLTVVNQGQVVVNRRPQYLPPPVKVKYYRESVRTPNFPAIAVKPINPFYYYGNTYSGVWGWATQYLANPNGNTRFEGDHLEPLVGDFSTSEVGLNLNSYAAIPSSEKDSAINRNKQKLLLKLKDQKVNLVQAVAERAQTASLLVATATRIAGAFLSVRRGNFRAAANHLGVVLPQRKHKRMTKRWFSGQANSLGNNWLELQYGWLPLISDVYGAAEHLAARKLEDENNEVRATTILKRSTTRRAWSGDVKFPGNVFQTTDVFWQVQHLVRYSITSSGAHELSQLGITNPALIAWELTPYSFVVDWFIPIGNWISSWDATLGLTFRDGLQTVFQRVGVECTKVGNNSNKVNSGSDCFLQGNREETYCKRDKLLSFPSPVVPSFKSPFSGEHIANALALLSTAFLRK